MAYYVIIRGALGIGKSTIAKALAKELDWVYVAIDGILEEYDLESDNEEGYISQKSFIKANEIAVERTKQELEKGRSLVFDGNFYWKSQIDDLIKRIDYPHYIFTLKSPLLVCINRDANREKSYGKDAAEAVYNKSTEFDYGEIINTENMSIREVIDDIKGKVKLVG